MKRGYRGPALPTAGLVAAALTVGGSSPVGAHPAHLVEPVTVRDTGYDPATVTIREESTVRWTWDTAVPHSVTFSAAHDSGMKTTGTYDRRFRTPGEYAYHSNGTPEITGTVIVEPFPGVAPRIRRLRVVNETEPKARFRLNKRADIVGRIKQRKSGSWRTVKTFTRIASRGRNRIRLPMRNLDPGRYRLRLKAYDIVGRRDSAGTRFRLRQP